MNELEVFKNKQSEGDDSIDRIKFLELERDVMKLNSEISNLKLTIREKDD